MRTMMMKPKGALRPISTLSLSIVLGLAALPQEVFAVDTPATTVTRTSYGSPGARSAGMGGAFVGLSDDSSATFLNPAGILLLPQKEVTLEVRNRTASPEFAPALPLGVRTESDQTDVSFASLAIPFESRRFGLGFFYGSLSNFDGSVSTVRQPAAGTNFFAQISDASLQDRYFGVSGAAQIGEKVRVGAAAFQAKRNYDASFTLVGAGSYVDNTSDADTGFNLGTHVSVSDSFSLGFTYRSQLEFAGESTFRLVNNPIPARNPISTIVPSAFTVGAGWKATDSLTFAFDVSRIRHSERVDDVTRIPEALRPTVGVSDSGTTIDVAANIVAKDGTDYRLGAEYSIPLDAGTILLRAGYWSESDPTAFHSRRVGVVGARANAETIWSQLFPGQGRRSHRTLGFGYAAENVGFDLAGDFADGSRDVVASVVIFL